MRPNDSPVPSVSPVVLGLFCILALVAIHVVPRIPLATDWRLEEAPEGYDVHMVKTSHYVLNLRQPRETDFYFQNITGGGGRYIFRGESEVTSWHDQERLRSRLRELLHERRLERSERTRGE